MRKLIDVDMLEREGWSLCRTFQKDKCTMVFEVKNPSDFPIIEERKTGYWDYNMSFCGSIKFIHRKCSECGYESMGMGTKYCPDCGTRMGDVEE